MTEIEKVSVNSNVVFSPLRRQQPVKPSVHGLLLFTAGTPQHASKRCVTPLFLLALNSSFQSAFSGICRRELLQSSPDMWKFFALILAAAALLAPPSARDWGGAGHQLIAAESYRQL